MNQLSQDEIDAIVKRVTEGCTICNGMRVLLKEDGGNRRLVNCSCTSRAYLEVKYRMANIPPKYADFDLRKLTKIFKMENQGPLTTLQQYFNSLQTNIDAGCGLFLHSESGLAKSSLACWVLKEGIKKDIQGYFIRASKLVELGFSKMSSPENAAKLEILTGGKTRLIVLDEFERIYLGRDPDSYASHIINEIIGGFYDNLVSLIVVSNSSLQELEGQRKFDPNIIDRMKELEPVVFSGESFRKRTEPVL